MAVNYQGAIDAINGAIATGVTSVSYEGKTTTFRSFEEMLKTVAYLKRQMDQANGVQRPNVGLGCFDRGYRTRGWTGGGFGC